MGKLVPAEYMQQLLPSVDHADVDALVAPTAQELLILTEQALADLENGPRLSDEQKLALSVSLRARLMDAIGSDEGVA